MKTIALKKTLTLLILFVSLFGYAQQATEVSVERKIRRFEKTLQDMKTLHDTQKMSAANFEETIAGFNRLAPHFTLNSSQFSNTVDKASIEHWILTFPEEYLSAIRFLESNNRTYITR